MSPDELYDFLENECHYQEIRYVDGVGFCALQRMLFTWGVMLALDEVGPAEGRYCFADYWSASLFLKEWDGKTEPVAGQDGCTANKRSKRHP